MILAAGIITENVVVTRIECKYFRCFYCSPGWPEWKEEGERSPGRQETAGTTRGPHTHLPRPRLWPAPGEPPPGLSLDGHGRTAAHWNHWVDSQVKEAQGKSRPLFFWHFPCLVVVVSLWCVCEYLSPIARSHLRVMGFQLGRLQEMLAQRQGREWLWGEGQGGVTDGGRG